jgi:3'-phosphoadenosine 5'-phosphosulfate (PAPS) 3'-phosphatase
VSDADGAQGLRFGRAWSAALRRGTDAELRGWLDVALAACDTADEIARRHFRRDMHIETKPDRTYVTEADRAVERSIRERLTDAFPDHGLVGEEYGVDAGDASIRWYIDPIDGTHNFIRGVPVFGTLLAVERDGELQASVISAPALGDRWWGWRRRRLGASRRCPAGADRCVRHRRHRERAGPLRVRPRPRGIRARARLRRPAPGRLA